ncbi:hypothetical protein OY671_011895, partial [Metschnikowia pulcherrima]
TRSGARAGLLRGDHGRSRGRTATGNVLAGASCKTAWRSGWPARLQASQSAAVAAARPEVASQHRGGGRQPPHRSSDSPHRTRSSGEGSEPDRGDPLRQLARSCGDLSKDQRPRKPAVPRTRFRPSISGPDIRRGRGPGPPGDGKLQHRLQSADREGG